MSTDEDIINLLRELREPAASSLQYDGPRRHRPSDIKEIWDIVEPLKEAMNNHAEFGRPLSKFFIGKQLIFTNDFQPVNLMRVAVERGAEAALAWYRRIRLTESTGIRVVAEVYGLWVEKPHTFSNRLTLLPLSMLPDSPNSRSLKQYYVRPGFRMSAAIMFELDDVHDEDHQIGHNRFLAISATMRKTVTAFVLSDDAAPAMTEIWQEFVDTELAAAEIGRMWTGSLHEGRLPNHPAHITESMIEWVEKYLQLPAEVSNFLDVPLSRLNQARRRLLPGDQAIDGSVCLEALLSRDRGELTHKVSTRTALLLGLSLEDRKAIKTKVSKFYALRSNMVHAGASKNEEADRQTASAGLSLCREVLRSVVESRKLPQPEDWDLTGGPDWNRYVENP